MAEQKPRGVTWESWTETLIRRAQDEGQFRDLPGEGRPLPGIERPYDELWWARSLLEREQIAFLPDTLMVRRDVERTIERLARIDSEPRVRAALEDLNARIRRLNGTVCEGPPSTVAPVDVDAIVTRWRLSHATTLPGPSAPPTPRPAVEPARWAAGVAIMLGALAFAASVGLAWLVFGP